MSELRQKPMSSSVFARSWHSMLSGEYIAHGLAFLTVFINTLISIYHGVVQDTF